MSNLRMLDDPELIKKSAQLIFEEEGEKFSPEFVKKYNEQLPTTNNKFGVFALKYRKKGWIPLLIAVVMTVLTSSAGIILGFDPEPSIVLILGFASLLKTLSYVAVFLWVILWFAYWLAPLQCCTFCKALYAREVVFEKHIPGTSSRATVDRTVSHDVKNKNGKVIGSIDENVEVDVMRAAYYTVYQCKKCKKMKIEILYKQFDA